MNEYLDVFANENNRSRSISPCGIKTLLSLIGLGASNNLLTNLINMYGTHYDMLEYIININKLNDTIDVQQYNGLFIKDDINLALNFKKKIDKYIEINNFDNNDLDKLNDLIKNKLSFENFFKQSEITHSSLIFLNILTFNDEWVYKFDCSETKISDFNCNDESIVSVPMMYLENDLGCYVKNDVNAIKLFFKNGAHAEFVMGLPSNSDFNNSFTYSHRKCTLYLPKFTHDETIDLLPIFKKANLSELTNTNNLNNIANDPLLHVSVFTQKNMCSFNEDGGQVKTVTKVCCTRGVKMQPIVLNFNKPFHYRIIKNNEILISGYYNGGI